MKLPPRIHSCAPTILNDESTQRYDYEIMCMARQVDILAARVSHHARKASLPYIDHVLWASWQSRE